MDGFSLLLAGIVHPVVLAVGTRILGLVFVVAGITKALRPERAAIALVDFGVTKTPRSANGFVLGTAELGLGIAVLIGPSPMLLAGTSILLWVFVGLISKGLSRGRSFPCFCFGDTSESLSRWTLRRTAFLACFSTGLGVVYEPYYEASASSTGDLLPFISALGCLGAAGLASRLPRLLRWNAEWGGRLFG